jgi:hypothetical protein
MSVRQVFTKSEEVKNGGWRMISPRAADGVGASDIASHRRPEMVVEFILWWTCTRPQQSTSTTSWALFYVVDGCEPSVSFVRRPFHPHHPSHTPSAALTVPAGIIMTPTATSSPMILPCTMSP